MPNSMRERYHRLLRALARAGYDPVLGVVVAMPEPVPCALNQDNDAADGHEHQDAPQDGSRHTNICERRERQDDRRGPPQPDQTPERAPAAAASRALRKDDPPRTIVGHAASMFAYAPIVVPCARSRNPRSRPTIDGVHAHPSTYRTCGTRPPRNVVTRPLSVSKTYW